MLRAKKIFQKVGQLDETDSNIIVRLMDDEYLFFCVAFVSCWFCHFSFVGVVELFVVGEIVF